MSLFFDGITSARNYLHFATLQIAIGLLYHDKGDYDMACGAYAVAADHAATSLSYIDPKCVEPDFYAEVTFVYLTCLARSSQFARCERACRTVLGAPFDGDELQWLKFQAQRILEIVRARN